MITLVLVMPMLAAFITTGACAELRPSRRRAYRMPMPAESPTYWSKAAVQALPDDGQHYELASGELLVTPAPSPRHERVLGQLLKALFPYVRAHRLGRVFFSKAELS